MTIVFALLALVGLALHVAFAVGLSAWAVRVAKVRGGAYRFAIALPGAGFFLSFLGGVVTVSGLIHAFGAVASVEAEARSATLAAGIAEAMSATALGLAAAILLYATSAIVSAVGSRRAREALRSTGPAPD